MAFCFFAVGYSLRICLGTIFFFVIALSVKWRGLAGIYFLFWSEFTFMCKILLFFQWFCLLPVCLFFFVVFRFFGFFIFEMRWIAFTYFLRWGIVNFRNAAFIAVKGICFKVWFLLSLLRWRIILMPCFFSCCHWNVNLSFVDSSVFTCVFCKNWFLYILF